MKRCTLVAALATVFAIAAEDAATQSRVPAGAKALFGGGAVKLGESGAATDGPFGDYELSVDFMIQRAGARAGVLLAERREIVLADSSGRPLGERDSAGAVLGHDAPRADAAGAVGEWQTLRVLYRHVRDARPLATVYLNDQLVHDAVELPNHTEGGIERLEPGAVSSERLKGLRTAWSAAETPDLSDGRFAFVATFRASGNGTLVGKAPASGKWAPHGKTLFLRGGRLVYDIGWVGALTSRRRFNDGKRHTVVLTHDDATALMFVDGVLEAEREDFVSEDAAGHVLKVGATSPDFGGGFERGEIERVQVFAAPLSAAEAKSRSASNQVSGRNPAIDWDPSQTQNPDSDLPADGVVRAPIRFVVRSGEVRFANAWIRPLATVDHRELISAWDVAARERGRKLYMSMCVACHGADGETVVNPLALPFSKGEFRNGNDPLSLFRTLTDGFRTMPPQTWMTPAQRYDVVHFLREEFLRDKNPGQYAALTDEYLESLPSPAPQPAETAAVAGGRTGLPKRDFGPALASQIGPGVSAGLTVRLPHDVTLGYDLHRLALQGAWTGAFLNLEETQHYKQRGEGIARPAGDRIEELSTWRWAFDGSFEDPKSKPKRGPVPSPRFSLHGHYVHGRDLVLGYAVDGRNVLEWPTAVEVGDSIALTHTLRIEPGEFPLYLAVAQQADATAWDRSPRPELVLAGVEAPVAARDRVAVAGADAGDSVLAAARVRGDVEGLTWRVDAAGRLVLGIPAGREPRDLEIVRARVHRTELDAFVAWSSARSTPVVDLRTKTRGGSGRNWPEELTLRGKLGEGSGSYVVDTLPVPFENPYGAWLRTSALDCFDDGRIAVSTLGGDVWIVSGVDDDLDAVRWSRFAAGLFEPLGLAVIDGIVHVTCRDGIVKLHDFNDDGEADFYEKLFADRDVTASFHAFNFDLQVDSSGNLYYVKSGRYTSYTLPGAVIGLTPDGSKDWVVATGFRTPNGMGILPDDSLLVSDNQGNWVPASKISRIASGGFYGVFKTGKREQESFDAPILWLPQQLDSSSGGQLWVDDKRFGPLAGSLLHTSFGKGWVYALDLQEVGDQTQASCVKLPFQFDAGVQRARSNPHDGQVYLVGLSGWQGPPKGGDGCLQRIRYTGRAETRLLGARIEDGQVELRFSGPVDADSSAEPDRYRASQWNYRWTKAYGSAHYSVARKGRKGRDELDVVGALAIGDGSRVRLNLGDLVPSHTLRIEVDVRAADGSPVRDTVHLTVYSVPR